MDGEIFQSRATVDYGWSWIMYVERRTLYIAKKRKQCFPSFVLGTFGRRIVMGIARPLHKERE